MNKLSLIARLILGFILLVPGGLNGFFQFIPMPMPPEAAANFMGALGATGYFFPVLKITELMLGILLLSNRFVSLALIIAAPITLQAFLFHLFLDPAGIAAAAVMVTLNLYLGWVYRKNYQVVLQAKTESATAE